MPTLQNPDALTTYQRVKARLTIEGTSFDELLKRMVNSVSAFIETYCDREFAQKVYASTGSPDFAAELFSVQGSRQHDLFLRRFPVTAVSAVQYRAGTHGTPSWTSYLTDEFVLVRSGALGILHLEPELPAGDNIIRVSYTGGYKIAWSAENTIASHTLPFDLTELCERLVVKRFKKRESEGRSQETATSSSVNWKEFLDEDDKMTLNLYRRPPIIL